jgi:hypothetical protein
MAELEAIARLEKSHDSYKQRWRLIGFVLVLSLILLPLVTHWSVAIGTLPQAVWCAWEVMAMDRSPLVYNRKDTWTVELPSPDTVSLSDGRGQVVQFKCDTITEAVWIFENPFAAERAICGVLRLHFGSGHSLRIPQSACGFDAFRQALASRMTVTMLVYDEGVGARAGARLLE